jgi:hypothetical protein
MGGDEFIENELRKFNAASYTTLAKNEKLEYY